MTTFWPSMCHKVKWSTSLDRLQVDSFNTYKITCELKYSQIQLHIQYLMDHAAGKRHKNISLLLSYYSPSIPALRTMQA